MLALVMPMPLMMAVVAMVISLFIGTFPSFGCIRVFDDLVQFPAIEPDPATHRAAVNLQPCSFSSVQRNMIRLYSASSWPGTHFLSWDDFQHLGISMIKYIAQVD